ncbi:hypothetical protein [Ruegeria atlantica]|uniref:hypothetical protein n=1 Tax=Ruegeria atlantica TaxID=81569 RepID=UPI00147997E1|nr:hypothetical protein [Ruegeria atlantica]
MTFFGIAILAVPVWSMNVRKKSLHKIKQEVDQRRQKGDTSVVNAVAEILQERREDSVNTWRRADETCLIIGYVLLLGSALWRIFA